MYQSHLRNAQKTMWERTAHTFHMIITRVFRKLKTIKDLPQTAGLKWTYDPRLGGSLETAYGSDVRVELSGGRDPALIAVKIFRWGGCTASKLREQVHERCPPDLDGQAHQSPAISTSHAGLCAAYVASTLEGHGAQAVAER